MHLRRPAGGLAFALTLLTGSPAVAVFIQLDVTGIVDGVSDEGILDGSVAPGTPFHASILYDRDASPANTSLSSADWAMLTPPAALTFEFGNYVATPAPAFGDPVEDKGFRIFVLDAVQGVDDFLISAPFLLEAGTVTGDLVGSS